MLKKAKLEEEEEAAAQLERTSIGGRRKPTGRSPPLLMTVRLYPLLFLLPETEEDNDGLGWAWWAGWAGLYSWASFIGKIN